MKNLKKLLTLLILASALFVFQACNDDDDDMPNDPVSNTITDFVIANQANYSILLEALLKADGDLPSVLAGPGPFTVFAPDNEAFNNFLDANGLNSLDDVPSDVLTQILLNHVVTGDVRSGALSTGYISSLSTATPNGASMSMYINTANGVQINGVSNVVAADNAVDNGVIHLVDAVIGLPNIVTMATSNGNFTNLVAALTRDDQPDFVGILSATSDPAPFTVFAPTDDAFASLLTELGASGLADIDGATLTATLQNHVVGGANVVAGDLTDNMTIATLGGDITANVSGGARLTDANGRVSNIIATDVQTSNGVIHVIDKVVLPYIEPASNTIADFVIANQADYSSLLAAVQKAGLVETLMGDTKLTVFAPNNDAFAAFLDAAGFASLDDVPVDVLTQILLNHVVAGDVRSTDLSTGYVSSLSTATPNGANMSMYIDISNGVNINGTSIVTAADNVVDNGVVHLVDAVIGLPTVVTMATSNGAFSNLVAALTRDDQPDFVSILSSSEDPAPFTVFAPTDDAFAALLEELGASGLNDIDAATLTATLQNHVVGGANVVAGDLTDNMTVTTLGGDITANISGGATLTDANGRVSNIIATDVQTSNGVIHVIDKVVLPYIAPPSNTIADFVIANEANYSSLLAAVQKAGLVETLMGDTKLTVFAPNNAAFDAFLQSAGFNNLDEVPTDILTQIVLNHVVAGDVRSTDLSTGYVSSLSTATPNGANMSMYIDTSTGVMINGSSSVTGADNVVDNGVVHLVDAVIGLPTIVTMATSNSAFSNLVAALTREDQPDFVSILSSSEDPAPFTVFAPTDDAFVALLAELGASGLGDIDGATLTATLNHHVIGGANVVAADLTDNMTVSTLGGNITADVTGGPKLTDANGRESMIIATDVQTSNGVIHVINKVILPPLN